MTHVDKHTPNTPAWFDLMTPDRARARAFYGELFNWSYLEGPPESGHYTMAQVDGRNAAGIGQQPPGSEWPSVWTAYFLVTDADQTVRKAGDLGGNVVMPPMDVMDAGRMAIISDPTGAVVGLWQPRAHTGAQVRDEAGAMAWAEVHTRDAAAARDFYALTFGLVPSKLEGMEYWQLAKDGAPAAGVHAMSGHVPAEVPPHWLVYFRVDDADRAAARVSAGGGTIRQGPFDSAWGRMAVFADPFGATFAVIARPPAA